MGTRSKSTKRPRDSADPVCLSLHDEMKATRSIDPRADRIPVLREIFKRSLDEGCDVTAYAVTGELLAIFSFDPTAYAKDIEALAIETEKIEGRIFSPKDLARLRSRKRP